MVHFFKIFHRGCIHFKWICSTEVHYSHLPHQKNQSLCTNSQLLWLLHGLSSKILQSLCKPRAMCIRKIIASAGVGAGGLSTSSNYLCNRTSHLEFGGALFLTLLDLSRSSTRSSIGNYQHQNHKNMNKRDAR